MVYNCSLSFKPYLLDDIEFSMISRCFFLSNLLIKISWTILNESGSRLPLGWILIIIVHNILEYTHIHFIHIIYLVYLVTMSSRYLFYWVENELDNIFDKWNILPICIKSSTNLIAVQSYHIIPTIN